jgi:hypothetical protein
MIMLLTNTQSLDMDVDSVDSPVMSSTLHWLPFKYRVPETTRVTLQRYRYQKNDNHFSTMFGVDQDSFDYWSVQKDAAHWVTEMYTYANTPANKANKDYWSHIQFDANQDLVF